jgi:hypothetical protein
VATGTHSAAADGLKMNSPPQSLLSLGRPAFVVNELLRHRGHSTDDAQLCDGRAGLHS